jgi:uncharacterized coiled-coil protein SlyX
MAHFLNTLPRDPDEQLRVGLQTIELAYGEKARQLDAEVQSLRAYGKERQTQVVLLERRVGELELQVGEGEQRARELAAENAGLVNEKAALFNEVRQLQERLGKLDQFKRAIMQSISENDPPISGTRAMLGAVPHEYGVGCSGFGCGITSSLGGGGGPAFGAAHGVPAAYVPLSPPSPSFAMRESAASAAARPAGSGAPTPLTSPPTRAGEAAEGGAAALDGKDFFRAARLRLSCVSPPLAPMPPPRPPLPPARTMSIFAARTVPSGAAACRPLS